MIDKCRSALESYIKTNPDKGLEIAQEINYYNGSLEWVSTSTLEEIVDITMSTGETDDILKLIQECVESGAKDGDDLIRFDNYGRMEVVDERILKEEIKDFASDVLDALEDFIDDYGEIYKINICEAHDQLDLLIRNNSLEQEED